jgi:RES domain-containing protein
VYASLDPETALAESLAHYRRFGVPIRDAMPRTLNAVSLALHRILDLTAGTVRRHLAVSQSRMLAEEWWIGQERDEEAVTQAVGRAAQAAGLEGLIVPSAARLGGKGLVYFPDNRRGESSLAIINPDDLLT